MRFISLCLLAVVSLLSSCAEFNELTRDVDPFFPVKTAPSQKDTATALRQALEQGVQTAIGRLGQYDGFLQNQEARIPLPSQLDTAAEMLRQLGQQRFVTEFTTSMNRAAEQAVPVAREIFTETIRTMSLGDAVEIVQGNNTAATDYFRHRNEKDILRAFRPLVEQATRDVGVTDNYKQLITRLGPLSGMLDEDMRDIDQYITQKAADAVFRFIAKEEQAIRENPVQRTTALMKEVFKYYTGSRSEAPEIDIPASPAR